MGMFDSFIDANGDEWQTKAYGCDLEDFAIGDPVPFNDYSLSTYQVEVLGGPDYDSFIDSFATIRRGSLLQVPAERDPSLPLLNYSGHLVAEAEN